MTLRGERELPPGLVGAASPRAGLAYRGLRLLWRLIGAALRFRLAVEGLEHLPRDRRGRPVGGWIAAGLPHRTWIDPFVLWAVLPAEPRLVFFGDARTMARSPLRRFVVRRVGGILPIPSGASPRAAAIHLAAAQEVLATGAVFCLFPEVGPAAPPGTARRLGSGLGYIALRSDAQVVPLAIGGNDELFLGRRIVLRILPPLAARELAGLAPDAPLPTPGTSGERNAAHRLVAEFHARTADAVAATHAAAAPAPGTRRLGRRLTTLFR
jgi:1-acyl-sn-glycerol-3-phosphate acyltransferase